MTQDTLPYCIFSYIFLPYQVYLYFLSNFYHSVEITFWIRSQAKASVLILDPWAYGHLCEDNHLLT